MYRIIQKMIFFWKAQTAHGLHSPLVYDLYNKVINPSLWKFDQTLFIHNLNTYLSTKSELNGYNILIINTLEELNCFKNKSSQIVLILDPYRDSNFYNKVQRIEKNESFNFIIHFFEGSIYIPSKLAPRQIFYLNHMK